MPNFQQSVRLEQTFGFQGEIIYDGPIRGKGYSLESTLEANNIFGRVFTNITAEDEKAKVGGAIADGFAGILTSPKQNVTAGASTGALEPTLVLRNEEIGEIIDMGIIIVYSGTAVTIGADVYYDPIVGNATAGQVGVSGGVYTAQVPNAKFVRNNTSAAGLAIVQLTN